MWCILGASYKARKCSQWIVFIHQTKGSGKETRNCSGIVSSQDYYQETTTLSFGNQSTHLWHMGLSFSWISANLVNHNSSMPSYGRPVACCCVWHIILMKIFAKWFIELHFILVKVTQIFVFQSASYTKERFYANNYQN